MKSIALLLALSVLAGVTRAADTNAEAACRANLRQLRSGVRAYRLIHDQQNPAKLSDLYLDGLVANLGAFVCPAASNTIVTLGDIDSKSDYTLDPAPGVSNVIVREKAPHHDASNVFAALADGAITMVAVAEVQPRPAPSATHEPPPTVPRSSGQPVAKTTPLVPSDLELGDRLLKEKNYTEAEAALRRAAAATPDNADVNDRLGEALYSQRRYAEAEGFLRTAIRQKADDPWRQNRLGFVLYSLNKFAEAQAVFAEAVRLSPDVALFHQNLADTLRKLGRTADAEREARRAVELQPAEGRNWLELGRALAAGQKWSEAEQAHREAVRLDPSSPWKHDELGTALYKQRRYDDAVKEYREAVRLAPKEGGLHANLAGALYQSGQREEAMASARESRRLGCMQHWVLDELGLAPLITDQDRQPKRAPAAVSVPPMEPFTTLLIGGKDAHVTMLNFSPSGDKLLVVTSIGYGKIFPGEVSLWDARDGHALWRSAWLGWYDRASIHGAGFWRMAQTVMAAGLDRDKDDASAPESYVIRGYAVESGQRVAATPVNPRPDTVAVWGSGGQCFAGPVRDRNNAWMIWDGQTGQLRCQLEVPADANLSDYWGTRFAISPDGQRLVVAHGAYRDGKTTTTIFSWDTATGKLLRSMPAAANITPRQVAFAPDNRTLALAGSWSEGESTRFGLWLCDVAAGDQRCTLDWPAVKLPSNLQPAVAFTPRGDRVACGLGSVVRVWNVADGSAQQTWSVPEIENDTERHISSLCFSPDGQTLAVGYRDGVVRLWRPTAR